MTNIKSIKSIGKYQTYDLEVNHPDHQFYLSNGILTSNSHSIAYSILSYLTAYYKCHFPLEFLLSNLMSEVSSNQKIAKDNIAKIKEEIRKLNVKILPPDINKSDKTYTIIDDNTLLTGLDALKFIGKNAIPAILSEREKGPFTSFEDFMNRVDSSKVKVPVIQALAASGTLDSFNMPRKLIFLYASDYKKKLQLFIKNHSKNPKKHPTFSYPFPKEDEWDPSEICALERFYLGESLSGNKVLSYKNFFTYTAPNYKSLVKLLPPPKLDMDENDQKKYKKPVSMIQAEIKSMFAFRVKKEDSKIKGQEMCKLVVEDPYHNQMTLTCFPDGWVNLQNFLITRNIKLEPGVGIFMNCELNWYNGELCFLFKEAIKACPPPPLPKDLESKKVSLKKLAKIVEQEEQAEEEKKKEEESEIDRNLILEEIEEDLIESGHSDLDDEEID
jgi:DNA polymerase III alpha subunit